MPNTPAQMALPTAASWVPTSSSCCCRGVSPVSGLAHHLLDFADFGEAPGGDHHRSSRCRPVTMVPRYTMLSRLGQGMLSPERVSTSFDTGMLSPVREDSLTLRLSDFDQATIGQRRRCRSPESAHPPAQCRLLPPAAAVRCAAPRAVLFSPPPAAGD